MTDTQTTIQPIDYIDFRKLDKEIIGYVKKVNPNNSRIAISSIPKNLFINDVDSFIKSITDNQDIIKNHHLTSVMDNVFKELNFVSDFLII